MVCADWQGSQTFLLNTCTSSFSEDKQPPYKFVLKFLGLYKWEIHTLYKNKYVLKMWLLISIFIT